VGYVGYPLQDGEVREVEKARRHGGPITVQLQQLEGSQIWEE